MLSIAEEPSSPSAVSSASAPQPPPSDFLVDGERVINSGRSVQQWVPLSGVGEGDLHVRVEYIDSEQALAVHKVWLLSFLILRFFLVM